MARARRARGRQPLRGARDRPDTAGRARAGGRAPARPLAAGPRRRGAGGAALGRARDRQVPHRPRPLRASRRRAACPGCATSARPTTSTPRSTRRSSTWSELPASSGTTRRPPGWTSSRPCWPQGTDRAGEAAPLIAALLSIPPEGRYPPLTAAPQRQREATIDVLVEQVAGLARRQPVLCVFEDLHWADPTTLELLDRLVGRIPGERVLLLLTFRPEFPPPWRGRPHATLISLNRLPRRQSAALAEAVAGGRALPDAVLQADRRQGRRRAAVRRGADQGRAGGGGRHAGAGQRPARAGGPSTPPTIPATLQDSLMARLDRLAGAKEVAQIGAAIGREFGYELLAAVSPLGGGRAPRGLGTARRLRAGVRPGRAAGGDLHLQARPGAGRGLREPAQEPAPAAAREDRSGAGGTLAGDRGRPGPSCSPITSRRPVFRTRRRPTGSRPGGRRSAARRWPRRWSTCSVPWVC